MNLVPSQYRELVMQHLIADIHAHADRLTTGDVGNRYLFKALLENGSADLWYKMLAHDDVPGYGFQIKKGMTTLTEQWNPEMGASMNHFMMAHINNHFIPNIVGIKMHEGKLTIAPQPMGDLAWAKGATSLANGKQIEVAWKRLEDGKLEVSVDAASDVEYQIDTTEYQLIERSNGKATLDGTYSGKHIFVGKRTK